LANGSATCPLPAQAICDRLGSSQVQSFLNCWINRVPTPLTGADGRPGYWWELSTRQVEVRRATVFDDPRRARGFFEALVADIVAIGRSAGVSVVFARQVRKTTKEPFRT
jgi:hypothetical protein